MVKNNRKRQRILYLKKENEVKDFFIKELFLIITKNKIKIHDDLMKKINFLYGGNSNGTEEKRNGA